MNFVLFNELCASNFAENSALQCLALLVVMIPILARALGVWDPVPHAQLRPDASLPDTTRLPNGGGHALTAVRGAGGWVGLTKDSTKKLNLGGEV